MLSVCSVFVCPARPSFRAQRDRFLSARLLRGEISLWRSHQMKVLSFLAALLLTFPNLEASPQASAPTSTSPTQAATLLSQSVAALTGKAALSDVTLTGTARRIAGSDDET